MKKIAYSFFMALCLLSINPPPCVAQVLPEPVVKDVMGLTKQSEATMRFLGLKVYDIRLYTPMKPFSPSDLFALELQYDLAFKGKDIAERSVKEMREQGYKDEAKLKRWGEEMTRIFPDVKQGEKLIGVSIPGKEVRFYSSEKFIAAVQDIEFAKAFFDIWLSEKTSEPKVRDRLLKVK